jgi:hypothetical protein
MKKSRIVALIFCLLVMSVSAKAVELTPGFTRPDNLDVFRDIKTKFGYRPFSLVEVEVDDIYWGVSRDGKGIAKYDLSDKKEVFGWPLKRWPQELENKKVADMYTLASDPEFALGYEHTGSRKPVLGCLAHRPLCYGDFDDNGKEEVVLFLGKTSNVLDMVVFNPEKEKIQFSARTIFTDVTDWDYGDRFKYQYASKHNMNKGFFVGTKTYAKIFMGEFDGNEANPDIIVWRKHYSALPKSSDKKGFDLKAENYQFYTLKDGEYKLQVSLEAQIESWMSEHELTWSKGYPSKSECKGMEGQLIPEMHDPLLNDPDVLQ